MSAPSPAARACRISPHRLRCAARVLRADGVIAHATEGVWGLACDPFSPRAVSRVLALKQRDPGRGLILIAHDAATLAVFVAGGAHAAWRRATAAWPGPHTWLLPARPDVPRWITGSGDRVALRQTAHVEARALCAAFGGALVSTSANVSGRPPVRSAWQARAAFGAALDVVAGGRVDQPGTPSSIRDACDQRVLRGSRA